jgi:hypothetical protein
LEHGHALPTHRWSPPTNCTGKTRSFLSDPCSLNPVSLGPQVLSQPYTARTSALAATTQFHHGNIHWQACMHAHLLEIPEQKKRPFCLAAHTYHSCAHAFLHTSDMRQERASLILTKTLIMQNFSIENLEIVRNFSLYFPPQPHLLATSTLPHSPHVMLAVSGIGPHIISQQVIFRPDVQIGRLYAYSFQSVYTFTKVWVPRVVWWYAPTDDRDRRSS